ncbi:MAG TPA: hypothetical protein VFG04_12230, partial [Planctomycetaceae bacterium]|nr:hypothetical protein [Planctomycetaceae bacterium]
GQIFFRAAELTRKGGFIQRHVRSFFEVSTSGVAAAVCGQTGKSPDIWDSGAAPKGRDPGLVFGEAGTVFGQSFRASDSPSREIRGQFWQVPAESSTLVPPGLEPISSWLKS